MPATHEPRYKEYGLFDAYTGELVSKHKNRRAAKDAKNAHPRMHELRVRGIPAKKGAKR